MKVGDKVRVMGIPEGLSDDGGMNKKSVFQKCLGETFTIAGFDGLRVELMVENVTGKRLESIFIDPEYLEVVSEGVH